MRFLTVLDTQGVGCNFFGLNRLPHTQLDDVLVAKGELGNIASDVVGVLVVTNWGNCEIANTIETNRVEKPAARDPSLCWNKSVGLGSNVSAVYPERL